MKIKRISKRVSSLFPVAIVIYLSLILVGCGAVGMMASKTESFTGDDSITLQAPREDILNVVAEVGKSLGYSVSSLDKKKGVIVLHYNLGSLASTTVGKIEKATLGIRSEEDGKKLFIGVKVIGNFGEGGQEAAMKRIEDFKAKLLEKIGQH